MVTIKAERQNKIEGQPVKRDWATYALLDLFSGGQIAVQHVQVTWDIKAYVVAFEDGIPLNRKSIAMLKELRRQTSRIAPEFRR